MAADRSLKELVLALDAKSSALLALLAMEEWLQEDKSHTWKDPRHVDECRLLIGPLLYHP